MFTVSPLRCATEFVASGYIMGDSTRSRGLSGRRIERRHGCRRWVRSELNGLTVRLQQQNCSATKIFEERLQVDTWNLARPDHLRMVNVGGVVDPVNKG